MQSLALAHVNIDHGKVVFVLSEARVSGRDWLDWFNDRCIDKLIYGPRNRDFWTPEIDFKNQKSETISGIENRFLKSFLAFLEFLGPETISEIGNRFLQIPGQFIQPPDQRLSHIQVSTQKSIPTIDVSQWADTKTAQSICEAARTWEKHNPRSSRHTRTGKE
ncbi:2-oxoglutarate (2OG) and Fe(II)-dependent oxygenase superfamily protein [Striga asiatica]|uniref:2-oxoglutarate (2OG) and Fe(II)-dependent oxygenase superfamily protein n=1 Tax=Striga asiatica TaxID=4170 RepID=A0A5A7P879_STRAF|nr:2-oxoglutarate (2OG) and Fe(II)-dependent oxygenase superfamily protein [Striga asiatica]